MFLSESRPPTKNLMQHIKRRDWARARLRTLTSWDAHYRTRSGSNPLHLVCLYRAPLDFVDILLNANPSALFQQDSEGWTPIHLVLLHGGDEEIAKMLIRRGGATAVSLQSPFVGSPLHLACRHSSPMVIMEELIKANLSMATTANKNGTKPAEVLLYQFIKNRDIEDVMRILQERRGGISNETTCTDSSVTDLLDRLTLLLQAAKREERSAASTFLYDLIAHQAALGDLTPFIEIAMHLFQKQVKSVDDSGNTLLHIAASSPFLPNRIQYLHRTFGVGKDATEILVRSFSEAATFFNKCGDLPLHLALTHGRRTWETGISSIVRANSDALQVRDRHTRLYPFQLAAAYPARDDMEALETIFNLLLSYPHVLRG